MKRYFRQKSQVKVLIGTFQKCWGMPLPPVNIAMEDLKNGKISNKNKLCSYCEKHGQGKKCSHQDKKEWLSCLWQDICPPQLTQPHWDYMLQQGQANTQPINPPNATNREAEDAIFDALCITTCVSQDRGTHVIHLDHHLYHCPSYYWIWQASKSWPFITLTATACREDYMALGYKPVTPPPRAITVSGCHICLTGIKVIWCLLWRWPDLSDNAHAHGKQQDKDPWLHHLRFYGRSPPIHQNLLLSAEACAALAKISENFSTVGKALQVSTAM